MKAGLALLLGGVFSAGFLALLLKRADALPLDHPNERSLHSRPTPRIGGLGLIPAAMVAALVTGFPAGQTGRYLLMIAGLACVLFFVSIFDDRRGLSVILRLTVHLIAAGILSIALLDSAPLAVLVAIAVAGFTNLYNFMDGANGLAGGMALFGFSTFGLAAGEPVLAFALAGASLGFLVFNFDPARLFMGDAGSIPLGFLAGGLGVLGVVSDQWPLWFPMMVFAPFLIDGSVTLARRILRRERFWNAHREHYYQRLVRMGWTHRRLALAEYALMAAGGFSALALLQTNPLFQGMGLGVWLMIYAGLMWAVDSAWSAHLMNESPKKEMPGGSAA